MLAELMLSAMVQRTLWARDLLHPPDSLPAGRR
jgi:hypothetical protein